MTSPKPLSPLRLTKGRIMNNEQQIKLIEVITSALVQAKVPVYEGYALDIVGDAVEKFIDTLSPPDSGWVDVKDRLPSEAGLYVTMAFRLSHIGIDRFKKFPDGQTNSKYWMANVKFYLPSPIPPFKQEEK